MLDKISYRGPAGRELIETPQATIGIVYNEYQKELAKNLRRQLIVRDGLREHFAQAEAENGTLRISRDAVGVTPLYYSQTEQGELCFASEVKALIPACQNVVEFPPGHRFDGQQMELVTRFQPGPLLSESPGWIVAELRRRMDQTVAEVVGDYDRVGVLLSGELDSSVIAALARHHTNVLTFTIGLDDAPALEGARTVANFIGTAHHEIRTSRQELIQVLPQVIYHLESFDALLVRSSLIHFLIARKAAEHVPVVLVGEGADALFAGHAAYQQVPLDQLAALLFRGLQRMHSEGLQRVDRCSAAHGLLYAIPFLERNLADFALRIPPGLKVREGMEKWCLREASKELLPELVRRKPKAKFWDSGGVREEIADWAQQSIPLEAFDRECILPNGWRIRTREELAYYRLFRDYFGPAADNPLWVGRTEGAPREGPISRTYIPGS